MHKLLDVLEHYIVWFEELSSNLQRTKESYKNSIRIFHLQAEMGPRPPKHKEGMLHTWLQYSIPQVLGHSTRHRLSCIHSSHFTHNDGMVNFSDMSSGYRLVTQSGPCTYCWEYKFKW